MPSPAKRSRTDGNSARSEPDSELCGLTVATYVDGFHDKEAVQKMRYRYLGSTGMKVSILSYGASSLGSVFRETDLGDSVQVVQDSIKAGINMVDCAPWYGHGKAEKVLGQAFKGIPRSAFYYTTKCCRYDPEVDQMFDFSGERTLQSIDESLERTGLTYIDTVQIHDPEFAPSLAVVINETLPALQKAKEMGKIRNIGMTGYPLEVQRLLIEGGMARGIKVDTSLVYCHYSLNDTTLLDGPMSKGDGSFLDFLDRNGIGCIGASAISMGLLTARGPPDWHPAAKVPHIISACKAAGEYCTAKGVDFSKLAIHFALRQSRIPTTLVTSASPSRMAGNVRAVHETLSPAEEAVLAEILEQFFPWRATEKATWCGIEPAKYWKKLGVELELAKRYRTADKPYPAEKIVQL